MIKVLKPGLETTVQDQGRKGFYAIGMPPSGAVDQFAYTVGNMLVGNDDGAAALEMTYMGPELEFQQDAVIALTGGAIPPKINGKDVPMWETIYVRRGDVLSFGIVKHGARAYLAVAGGIDVPEIMEFGRRTPCAVSAGMRVVRLKREMSSRSVMGRSEWWKKEPGFRPSSSRLSPPPTKFA